MPAEDDSPVQVVKVVRISTVYCEVTNVTDENPNVSWACSPGFEPVMGLDPHPPYLLLYSNQA